MERSDVTYADVVKSVFEDPPAEGKKFVFVKDMAYQFDPNIIPLDNKNTAHSLLIRHPAKAIKSLYQKAAIE